MKKLVLILMLAVLVGGAAFSFDIHSFPSPIEKGDLLISPMVSIGYGWPGFGLGVPLAIEYALPIPFALSVGGETGVALRLWRGDGFMMAIPLMVKVAWHPNFEVRNLDVYFAVKLGAAIGIWPGRKSYNAWGSDYNLIGAGFAGGFDAGVRYFFTPKMAINGEVGYNRLNVRFRYKGGGPYGYYPFYFGSFLRVGLTFRV